MTANAENGPAVTQPQMSLGLLRLDDQRHAVDSKQEAIGVRVKNDYRRLFFPPDNLRQSIHIRSKMSRRNLTTVVFAIIFFLIVTYAASWFVHRSERTTQRFAAHLNQGRYGEAAEMLCPSCSIKLGPDGSVTLIDRAGNSVLVPTEKLPFKVGGGAADGPGDFSMTALGTDTNGILDSPAIIVYFSVEGGLVCIERVDS